MKRFTLSGGKFCFWVLGFVLSFAAAAYAATPDQINIMPLGDSITSGSQGNYKGYRGFLRDRLDAALYSWLFVGSKGAGWWWHEGHSGYHAADHPDPNRCEDGCEIEINVFNWLDLNPADVVLLHIGTNDLNAGQSPAGQNGENGVIDEIEAILDEIDRFENDPLGNDVWVILAQIINRIDYSGETTELNGLIRDLVHARRANGDRIVVVDMEQGAGLDYAEDKVEPYDDGDMYDNLHPNDSGYEKMAIKWFEVLDDALDYMFEVGVFDIALTQDAASGELNCSYALGTDADTAATAWYKGVSPIMTVYLPMEGGATDALLDYSGSTNDGDCPSVSGVCPSWKASDGHDGHGYFSFDGSQQHIDPGSILPLTAYTKMAWVRSPADHPDSHIISGESDHVFRIDEYATGTGTEYRLTAGHNGAWNTVVDTMAFPQGRWVFAAVTYDAGTMVLYRDGIEVARATGVTPTTDSQVYIGSFGGDRGWHNGGIDDVRIYPYALSPQQIDSLYMNGRDIIVSQETATGEEWQCEVTPFANAIAGGEAGVTRSSNPLIYEARADANGDGDVDGSDLQLLIQSFNTAYGNPNFDDRSDFDLNGTVDAMDLEIFAREFGDAPAAAPLTAPLSTTSTLNSVSSSNEPVRGKSALAPGAKKRGKKR
jgi:hypothetical protein